MLTLRNITKSFNSRILFQNADMTVNCLGTHGRWAFAEFCDIYEIESDFKAKVAGQFSKMITEALSPSA